MHTTYNERHEMARRMEGAAEARLAPPAGGVMEARTHCAYNLTRECFLGLEVTAANLPYPAMAELMAALLLKPGEGLWLAPFRGICNAGMRAPLDLIYLDEECRVVDTVESFPTFAVSGLSPRAASVLVLPAHSIYSSQTQPGDQLVLCVAEEMERRLAGMTDGGAEAESVQSAVLLRERPLWSSGPGVLELGVRAAAQGASAPVYEIELMEPGKWTVEPPHNWLKRWWSPDPRRAPREAPSGLAAYYWNGGAPRYASNPAGLYVVAEERWYPATLLLLTVSRAECGGEAQEWPIAVQARAVRWGNAGVGVRLMVGDARAERRGAAAGRGSAGEPRALDRFLQQLRKGKM